MRPASDPLQLHPAVYRELVDLLYTALPQVTAIAGAATMAACALAVGRSDLDYALVAGLLAATGGLRLSWLMRYPRSQPLSQAQLQRWERLYALGSTLFCGALGVLSFLALSKGDQPGAWVGLGLSLSNCIGMISRAAVRPWIVALSSGVLVMPTIIGALLRPELPYQIGAVLLALFWLTLREASRHLSRDFIQRIEAERELAHHASHDTVTGLPNRFAFMKRLNAAAQSPGTAFAVLAIDLDGFKPVNDRLGHPVGDEVLKQIGARLMRAVGPRGIAARTGGDEFMLLLLFDGPEPDAASAEALAQRVIIQLHNPVTLDVPVSIGASVGIASGRAQSSRDELRQLLVAVDKALYDAKRAGGGVFRWADRDGAGRQAA